MGREKAENKKWLDAHYDPLACLHTFTQCICFSDIHADGDNKLVIADLGTSSVDNQIKLKVYKGTTLMTENTILDLPTGVVTFYMDTHEPRTPAIAVASGPYIYVYKNLRPYFKFTLPTLEVDIQEQDLWNQARDGQVNPSILREVLDNMRAEGKVLTVRSLKLLQLADHEIGAFTELHKHAPLKKQTVITCLDTLKKTMSDEDSISCLVLGTESAQVYVLDPEAFTVLATMTLPSVPAFLSVTGLYDVEFRIVVSCRNGGIYTLKRGDKSGKLCFEQNSQPVGMARLNKVIVVGCMDETLQCYTTKGKKLWTIKLPASVLTMEVLDNKQKNYKAVMVALSNKQVHIFRDKYLVDVIECEDNVTGMKYGRFGREDSCLVMTTQGGGLLVKMLKRTAQLEEGDGSAGPPAAQNKRLNVPKKTKLFVDQMLRERESSVAMHRQFQHDLYRLRLETARNYVNSLNKSMNPVSANPQEPLKLAAHIQGIGPMFKMTVQLQNTSLAVPSFDLVVTFQYDVKLYRLEKTVINVPMLVPGLNYAFELFVECLSEKGIADNIKVFVLKKNRSIPIITANISMPVSESIIVV